MSRLNRSLAILIAIAMLVAVWTAGGASAELRAPGPRDPHRYAELTSELNEKFAEHFNMHFAIDETVFMTSGRCGEQNAFYQDPPGPQRKPTIMICAELVHDIMTEFRYDDLSRRQKSKALAGNVAFIILHELGHALIDVLDLPIVGEHENAVDEFAALFLTQQSDFGLLVARYWATRNDFGDTGLFKGLGGPSRFADEHDFDRQRAADVLCYSYGSAPRELAYLKRELGRSATHCPRRFRAAVKNWDRLLQPFMKG
ncbi:DUF4344 domain-containing metallopeptidase [Rhodovibrio sodomensis]|uniref:DUF4344 domain-containing metallopeptidase n=1 Tax=Rhodovibrio sodomensis TaxID=1088 RepID=UPI00190451A0